MTDAMDMLELADWLNYMQRGHEMSICREDPAIKLHIDKLKRWQEVVRLAAQADAPSSAVSVEATDAKEAIARMLVPYWYGGFERQEKDEHGHWNYPPGTPNRRAYEIAEKALAIVTARSSAETETPVDTDDLLSRLDDQGLFNKAERIQMFKDAAAEIRRLRALVKPQTAQEIAEDCAQIAEGHVEIDLLGDSEQYVRGYNEACRDIAKAIRDAHGGAR